MASSQMTAEKCSHSEALSSSYHPRQGFQSRLSSLPPELHHIIADHLPYPDLLSLKLTNTYFAALVAPKLTVKSRISWVQGRYAQHLPVPTSSQLSFKSDALFVANAEVKTILRRRRQHLECADHERGRAFVFSSMFANLDLQVREGAAAHHPWTKVCLVTGNTICPRIQELEAKMQRYKNSMVGKLAVPVLRALAWLAGWLSDSLNQPWVMAGRLRPSGLLLGNILAMSKIVLIVVVICAFCYCNDISSLADSPYGIGAVR
ncbi:uncharacterized protein Z520_04281 [Fonsecaea multimorphosa CBS 102226]|uniref:F-box domain-containing protein n=1 Tax=Fonsecaea multimorphosa CBS 102226 TaxID=1442371 RepID=A0A0D2IRJ8_9EURO|nr:uncharacterized protein Z520_04281 [Fonsecaea multimorphosa CBS 102226]KIX99646.1 hypothetical protein Z520_04281 [Fonsecaea multimorphosa CBS 102226]OAL26698.1 hypothetical protein AYO22_04051 [Fonsecaea multimorphosa]